MNKKIKNRIFLTALKFCLGIVLIIPTAFSARWAVVKVEKAIIFLDVAMTKKLGFSKKGKKIRVGDKRFNKGRLVPVLVKGKVAYIQVKDLVFGKRIEKAKSVSQRLREKFTEVVEVKRVAAYSGTSYGLVTDSDFDSSEGRLFFEFGVSGYYHHLKNGKQFKLSLGYVTSERDDVELNYVPLSYGHKFFNFEYEGFNFLVYGGGIFAPYVEFIAGDLFKITGQAFGGFGGLEFRYKLSKKLTLHAIGDYQILRFINLDLDNNG